tara:strand:+ start:2263 stop:2637 length:375 start_codon:yes stop_codon:yes gene_type:complete
VSLVHFLDQQSVGLEVVRHVLPLVLFGLLHEVSVYQTGKRVSVTANSDVYLELLVGYPFNYLIHPLFFACKGRAFTDKNFMCPTARTAQITAVVNGQSKTEGLPNIVDAFAFYVTTLTVVAIPI